MNFKMADDDVWRKNKSSLSYCEKKCLCSNRRGFFTHEHDELKRQETFGTISNRSMGKHYLHILFYFVKNGKGCMFQFKLEGRTTITGQ